MCTGMGPIDDRDKEREEDDNDDGGMEGPNVCAPGR